MLGCSTSNDVRQLRATRLPASIESWADGKDPRSVENRLLEMYQLNPSNEMEWWLIYQQAKIWLETDAQRACGNFKKLSLIESFPLNKVSLLRSLEACSNDDKDVPTLDRVLNETTEPWLQELVRTTVLSRAIRLKDHAMEMQLSAEMVSHVDLQSQKVAYLNRAIALATSLKRNDLLKQYRARLIKIAPRFNKNPKPEELIAVANDHRQAREFDEARALYQKAVQEKGLSDTDKLRALDGIRIAYKNERKVDEYLEANRKMVEFTRQRMANSAWLEKHHDASILLARAIWTEKTQAEARKVLDQLEVELKGRKASDEINWIRARMSEENGRFEEAVAILEKAVTPGNPNKDLTEKITWYKAWNYRKLGRHEEAIETLKNLTDEYGSSTARSRNRFWMGKSLMALKKTSEAQEEFDNLTLTDPLSYYALLSYRELGRPLPAEEAPEPDSTDRKQWPGKVDSPFETQPEHDYIEWLISLSETRVAQDYLDHYVKNHPERGAPSTPAGRELLKYYARAGNYRVLFSKLGSFPSDVRDKIIDEEPSLLFPQPYRQLVSPAGQKYGVFPELIYSIMRQESSFDPLARSPADAFGLLQLIPEAAKRAERLTGIKIKSPEELYKPQLNIPVGAAFVRILMDQFEDDFIPSVASYNASEKAIHGWIETRYRGDSLEFIEDIPYDETRNYVKLVMRNYIFYLRINSEGRPVPFPEWCLESLQPLN